MLGSVGDYSWEAGRLYLGRGYWIMDDQPKKDRLSSCGCCVAILVLGIMSDPPWQLSPRVQKTFNSSYTPLILGFEFIRS